MKLLDKVIEKGRNFLRSLRTETVKTGGLEDLDYLKEVLTRLNVSEKSGSVYIEVVGDYPGRPPMERDLFNGQIAEQVATLVGYNPHQDFKVNRNRPYVRNLSFVHKRQGGRDSLRVLYAWQSMSRMDVYNYYDFSLRGTLADKVNETSQVNRLPQEAV